MATSIKPTTDTGNKMLNVSLPSKIRNVLNLYLIYLLIRSVTYRWVYVFIYTKKNPHMYIYFIYLFDNDVFCLLFLIITSAYSTFNISQTLTGVKMKQHQNKQNIFMLNSYFSQWIWIRKLEQLCF